jgi:hypothetical protein
MQMAFEEANTALTESVIHPFPGVEISMIVEA